MKILFLLSQLKKQGPNTQFLYLLEELKRKSVDVTVITYKNYTKENSLESLYKKYGIRIINCDHYSRLTFIKYFSKTSLNYDCVCSYGLESDFYNALFNSSKKISFVRNQLFYSYASVYGFKGYFLALLNYIFLKKMDIVFACSKAVQTYIKKFKLNSVYLTNSINERVLNDLASYDFKIQDDDFLHKRNKIDNAVFLTIASELKGKNTKFLLNCFASDDLKSNTLIVLGHVNDATQEKYNSYRNIIFTGFQPNIYSFYKEVDYFVSASLHEGLPNAVLEALYFEVPCLLSNIPEHLEILEKSKDTDVGYCFKNNDIHSFITNTNKITNLSDSNYGKIANQMINTSFNTKNTSIKFLEKILDDA